MKQGGRNMRPIWKELFIREHIEHVAVLPLSECRVTLPRLLEAEGFAPVSVILFLIPYFGGFPENLSAYAAAEDYHLFVRELYERLSPGLSEIYPDYHFRMYADHSPIDERHATVRAGLGVFGKNGLLLTEKYSSFQFIGEILTDAPAELLGGYSLFPLSSCVGCGKCLAACPTGVLRDEGTDCLSAVTQRKGELSEDETTLMRRCHTVWGCDECQRVCPYTERAINGGTIYTSIPFFRENRIERLTSTALAEMDENTFRRRAFAWRGRGVIERNTILLEKPSKE